MIGTSVYEAILHHVARSLGRLPSYVVAYLVEGEGFDNGAPLSPIVTDAVDEVAGCILDELARISAVCLVAGAAEHA
jgi:hypothetical protein